MKISYDPSLEKPEALGRNGLRILQPHQGFRFGQDSLLLAYFAASHVKNRHFYHVFDFCAGSGVVGLIFTSRLKNKSFFLQGVEWHQETAERLAKNYAINHFLQSSAWCGDVSAPVATWQNVSAAMGFYFGVDSAFPSRKTVDVILCNPPYTPVNTGISAKQAPWSRVELIGNLEGYLAQAANLLSPGGELYLCHRAERLPEILYHLENMSLRPKLLRFTQAQPDTKPKLLLLKATQLEKKGGFTILPPLYTGNGLWNEELNALYGEEERMDDAALYSDLEQLQSQSE